MKKIYNKIISSFLIICICCTLLPTTAFASNADIQKQMIQILYGGAGGRMSCDFDGYVSTSGRHEGIDFVASGGYGTSIYSLIDGVVTRCTNASGLSTCAIYDSTNDMTVIYLHSHFKVSAGDTVTRGQYLGYECNYGTSATHTHIEVRPGKKTSASKSVNDYTLDNPNPYSYWKKVLAGTSSCNCSDSYAGNYTCTTSSRNLTIRSGHGTSYSNVGSIPSGATVYVSKASGTSSSDWAHVEYNGISGYASMEYLSKQQNVVAGIKHWLSDSPMGEKVSTFTQGKMYYLCYELKDANTGKLLSEVGNYSYSVKQILLYPDGTVGTEYTYDNDNNWIALKCTVSGTYSYKIEVKVEGLGGGTFTKTFEVEANPLTMTPSSNNVNLSIGGTESQVVNIETGGYYNGRSHLNYRCSNSNVSCSWGEWTSTGCPLTIKAKNVGTTDVTVSIVDSDTGEVLLSKVIKVTVSKKSYTISYNANGGSGVPSNQTKNHNENITISKEIPERFGYTFLGWSTSKTATSASYKPGESYSSNASVTLYAVWQSAEVISSNVVNSSYIVSVPFANGYEYYKFVPSTTGKYRFESTGSCDSRIYLYASDQTSINWNDDAGSGTNFLLTEELKAGNTYYIKTCIYNSGVGEYTFTVKRVYDVVYDANGGTGEPSHQTKIHGTTLTLSSTKPTRDGYTFLGWNTSVNATTAKYQVGDSYILDESVKLYAVWQPNMSIIMQPTNVSVTEGQTASFTVKASGSNLKYQWQYCPSGSTTWNNLSASGSKTQTLNIEGTQAKNGYKYRCIVTDGAGNRVTSSSATLTVTANKPSAVSGLKIGGRATDALRLNWNKNSNASGYIIEQYKDDKWTRIARIGSNSTTTYRVEKLSTSTTYKFRVQSFNLNGSSANYSDWQYINGKTLPTTVSGLKIGGRATDALRLNWSKNSNASGYIVEQYKNGKWTRIAKIENNSTTTYRVEKLSNSTTYKFRVQSYSFDRSTPLYSSWQSINGKTLPTTVSGVKIGGRATDALRLNWNKNSNASGYIIEQYKNGKWTRIAKIENNSTTTYRVEQLSSSTTYKFRVQSYSFDGSTPLYSSWQSINGKTLPTSVSGLRIGGWAKDALRLNWDKNSNASGYIIEQYKNGKWTRIARIGSNSTTTYRVEKLSSSTTYKFRVQSFGFDGNTAIYSSWQYVNGTTK